jgi:endonuclease/exonuclease/phosphatase family metal-dependent hydrolase
MTTTKFSTATYNVLAQCHIRADRYPSSPPEALEADKRRRALLERLDGLPVDLLCLQEVEPDLFDLLRARLDASHQGAFAPRGSGREGSALFARRSVFAWDGHEVLSFAAQRRRDRELALIARLTVAGRPLHVAVTHLAWQPQDTAPAEHVGRRQIAELLDRRDAAPADSTWIVAGDFNAISQSVVLEEAYRRGLAESCRTQRPWDTTAINRRPRKTDYLLFSEGRLEPDPGILPRLTRATVMPSLTEPSDHLPLRVDFTTI